MQTSVNRPDHAGLNKGTPCVKLVCDRGEGVVLGGGGRGV